jgi:hypothetical protein
MADDLTEAEVLSLGYILARPLGNGEWLAVAPQLYTTGLFVVPDRDHYRTRYCYERSFEAVHAFLTWDGEGDPPGMWVKQKPEDRLNPKWLEAARREANAEAGDGT